MSNYVIDKRDKERDCFIETMKQIVEKYGVPENLYVDTGKAIIVMGDNNIKTLPKVENVCCKSIEQYFSDIIQKTEKTREIPTEFEITDVTGEVRLTLEFKKGKEKCCKKESDNSEKILNYEYDPNLIKEVLNSIKN